MSWPGGVNECEYDKCNFVPGVIVDFHEEGGHDFAVWMLPGSLDHCNVTYLFVC